MVDGGNITYRGFKHNRAGLYWSTDFKRFIIFRTRAYPARLIRHAIIDSLFDRCEGQRSATEPFPLLLLQFRDAFLRLRRFACSCAVTKSCRYQTYRPVTDGLLSKCNIFTICYGTKLVPINGIFHEQHGYVMHFC